ncbi:larval serum protein 1 gamma chain-like [Anastrepha ludens]|uniref:larval serum protein 1 gamma chain-like n=1 Tax=Anastrepha ludens TaxID=28586 RepID=UPI0023AF8B26|nr:larval serum protein 1 gamma chain-like [Anastrepha ludens]
MKLTLVVIVVALSGFVAAAGQVLEPANQQVKYADKEFLEKQKFLLEIVYRMENPLLFEEYLKYAKDFHFDKSDYTQYDQYMEMFEKAYKSGYLLPKGEFFGAMVKSHITQAWGLFNYFYYAKDFEAFMKVASWARVHVSEGMFVYALTLAVIHRDDFEGLMLPAINEILPQHFFTSKLILEAEKFDYDVWSKQIMYEKEYKDLLYADNKDSYNNYPHIYTKDWKTWQWWKMMGLGKHWYKEEKYMLRDNIEEFSEDITIMDLVKRTTHLFYMPTDYTRDLEYDNEHTKLSYFTEDVDLNAYWYYANIDYAFFLNSTKYGFEKERRGEYWAYNLQTMVARYYWERLSQELGETPEFSGRSVYVQGYNPQLIGYNGIGFGYRQNNFDYKRYKKLHQYNNFYGYYTRVTMQLDQGHFTTNNGTVVNLRKPEAIEVLANLLEGNADLFDSYFDTYWHVLSHTYFANADVDALHLLPHTFVNFETMQRDPFTHSYYKRFLQVILKFKSFLPPYTKAELLLPGVSIADVQVSELVTYFDFTDFDVSTLLNDKMLFVDGEFIWDKTLLARQQRLNHKPFTFDFTIESDKSQKVVIRAFLGPKFDQNRRSLSLAQNHDSFIEIDEFIYQLAAGKNTIKHSSQDFYWTIDDRSTYTELYKSVMLAYRGARQFPLNASQPHCGFPDRLLLPQGWEKGFPMQLFFFVAPYTGAHEHFPSYTSYTCGVGSGKRYIDDLPFGYPIDRPIDEVEFFVPNMFMKNVKVYHEDKLEKYFDKKYENFGTFDYAY